MEIRHRNRGEEAWHDPRFGSAQAALDKAQRYLKQQDVQQLQRSLLKPDEDQLGGLELVSFK